MDATELRTTCASTDRGVNVPSKFTVTDCPTLSATPHSARRPLAEISTSVALKPGGEMRRPVIDGTSDAGRRGDWAMGTYESSGKERRVLSSTIASSCVARALLGLVTSPALEGSCGWSL